MMKTLNNIFDEANASEIENLVNQNAASDVSADTLSSIKNKVYAKTGITKAKTKKSFAFRWQFYVAVAACLLLIVGGIFGAPSIIKLFIDDGVVADELYQVFIYDYSDSLPSAKHEVEYVFADYEKYHDTVVDDSVELLINGICYSGKFQLSQYREYNYFPVHRYVDENGFMFEVNEAGVLTSCFWGNTSLQGAKKTEAECVAIARDFLASIVNVNNYDFDVVEDSERGLYTVNFIKTIHDIETTDTATVVVKNDGSLYSYSSFMLGKVIDELIPTDTIDLNKVKESINNKLSSVYRDAHNVYSRIEYSEPDVALTVLKDGKLGVVCTVNVACIEIAGEFETVVSERISFVVVID